MAKEPSGGTACDDLSCNQPGKVTDKEQMIKDKRLQDKYGVSDLEKQLCLVKKMSYVNSLMCFAFVCSFFIIHTFVCGRTSEA